MDLGNLTVNKANRRGLGEIEIFANRKKLRVKVGHENQPTKVWTAAKRKFA